MYPISSRPIAAILMATALVVALATPSHAHGGGGGHGGGGHGGVGHGGAGPAHGGSYHGGGGSMFGGYGRDLDPIAASRIGWPSFPEDLPLMRLHRFLVQRRPLG
jgi:hypothetical protein